MNASRSNAPRWVGLLCHVYAGALWLYPRSHRKRWGAAMRQAFRDRCREAVREGRGPLNVLFAELLPDLATTVGSEYFDAIHLEANPMKRLLYVLVATFAVVVLLHSQVTPALDKAHGWLRHRGDIAYDRAYSAHLQALAQVTEKQRHDAHDDVTAAILYWDAARKLAVDYHDTATPLEMSDAIGRDADEALADRADAALARALKADDRQALWLAVRQCPARPAVCAKDASLARLEQIDAGNGAVWAYDFVAAQKANDPERSRAALARIAAASRFDTHNGEIQRALLLAFDKLPLPEAVVVDNLWTHRSNADSVVTLARALADGGYVFDEYSELKPFADYCRSRDAIAHADRRAECRAAGKAMAEQGDLTDGYLAWMRNAEPGELDSVRAAFREKSWRAWGSREHAPELDSESGRAAWKAAWLAGGDLPEVNRRLMRDEQIALNAPASFQLRPEQYDPSTY